MRQAADPCRARWRNAGCTWPAAGRKCALAAEVLAAGNRRFGAL